MTRDEVVSVLRSHEPHLRSLGIQHVALFGSRAREEHDAASDVDLAVKLDGRIRGLRRLSRLDEAQAYMSEQLGCAVDLVEEPTSSRSRLRRELARDAIRAF